MSNKNRHGTTKRSNSRTQAKNTALDTYAALGAYQGNITDLLERMKQPINQGEVIQKELQSALEEHTEEWYKGVVSLIERKLLVNDPTGILNQKTVFSTNLQVQKELPHWKLFHVLNGKVIQKYENQTVDSTATEVDPADLDLTSQESPTQALPPVEATEVATNIENAIQSLINDEDTSEETIMTNTFNQAFHEAHHNKIIDLLEVTQDSVDDDVITASRKEIKEAVRTWFNEYYASLNDLDNPNRCTDDFGGLVSGKTIFSTPDMLNKFDDSTFVVKCVEQQRAKMAAGAGREASPQNMAQTVIDQQDPTKKEVEMKLENGQTVVADKATGKTVVKDKDGFIIFHTKKAWRGLVSINDWIWNKLKAFGAWLKSLFCGKKGKERIDVTPEQKEQMEKDIAARAAVIGKDVGTPATA